MLKKILLTLDGSELARAAIAQTAAVAAGTDAEVTVLEVIEPLDTLRRQATGQFEFTDGDAQRIEALAQAMHFGRRGRALEELEAAKSALAGAGVRSVKTAIVEGLAGNEIVNFGAGDGSDAIVMATRGHGGLGREIVGSVAEYVLRHAGRMAVVLVGPRAGG